MESAGGKGQARLHSLSLIRDLLEKAESEGWEVMTRLIMIRGQKENQRYCF